MDRDTHHHWNVSRLASVADYLEHIPADSSPYLLPQWAFFWERVWSGACAEHWSHSSPSDTPRFVVAVRRRRALWDWIYCLPYGTPGSTDCDSEEWVRDLLQSMAGSRTLQVTFGGVRTESEFAGWKRNDLHSESYVLDLRQDAKASPTASASENHRRNIEKGRSASPTIARLTSAADVRRMQAAWHGSGDGGSRIVLNAARGPVFADVFGGSDSLYWYTAWHGDRPAATCIWLKLGAHSVYVDGATDRTALRGGLNHFLFAQVLMVLHGAGGRYFDFGGGPLGHSSEGLRRFKEGWGAVAADRYETVLRRPLYDALRRLIR